MDYNYFTQHGKSTIQLSGNVPTVATGGSNQYAVAYTALPIQIGCIYELEVLQAGQLVSLLYLHFKMDIFESFECEGQG